MIDLDSDPSAPGPFSLTGVDGRVFFFANERPDSFELWSSGGTTTGSMFVSEIPQARTSSAEPPYLRIPTSVNGSLYFLQPPQITFFEAPHSLWRSDGTTTGTSTVVDSANNPVANPCQLAPFGDRLLYRTQCTHDFNHGNLHITDGTPDETQHVLSSEALFPDVSHFAIFQDSIIAFINCQLSRIDSVTFDATELPDTTTPQSHPRLFATTDHVIYLGDPTETGMTLAFTDGTMSGADVDVFTFDPRATLDEAHVTGENLFFNVVDEFNAMQLWASDGKSDGTFRLTDLRSDSIGTQARELANVNGTLFFTTNDGNHGYELWKSNGTADGSGHELWRSEGTPQTTVRAADLIPGPDGSEPGDVVAVDGRLFFLADNANASRQLFSSRYGVSGDLNYDGIVDNQDSAILFGNWAGSGVADLINDGIVDALEAGILIANWSELPHAAKSPPSVSHDEVFAASDAIGKPTSGRRSNSKPENDDNAMVLR